MPTEVCKDMFAFPDIAIKIYNDLLAVGYTVENIFLIVAHLSFLSYGMLANLPRSKELIQEAIDTNTLMVLFEKSKLC